MLHIVSYYYEINLRFLAFLTSSFIKENSSIMGTSKKRNNWEKKSLMWNWKKYEKRPHDLHLSLT